MVPETGLEPARVASLGPKPSVSTNFTTPAFFKVLQINLQPDDSTQK